MKKAILFVIMLTLVFLSACAGGGVTKFAYTTYKTADNQVAYYDSTMEGTHVYIFENESKMPNGNDEKYKDNNALYRADCDTNSIITIRYKRSLGVEEVNGAEATLVEMEKWYYIEVTVKKDSDVYSAAKNVYLNDVRLEKSDKHDSVYEGDSVVIYHYENCGLNCSNPNGHINDALNVIEYR